MYYYYNTKKRICQKFFGGERTESAFRFSIGTKFVIIHKSEINFCAFLQFYEKRQNISQSFSVCVVIEMKEVSPPAAGTCTSGG